MRLDSFVALRIWNNGLRRFRLGEGGRKRLQVRVQRRWRRRERVRRRWDGRESSDGLEVTSDFRARDWGWRRTDFDKGDVEIEINRHGQRGGMNE